MLLLKLLAKPGSARQRNEVPGALTVGLIAFVFAYATVMLTRGGDGIAILWISNAVILAAALIRPTALLPLLLSGAAGIGAANVLAGIPLQTSTGFLVANGADVLVGLVLMRRLGSHRFEFGSLSFLARFVPACVFAGPAVSATLGAAIAGEAFGSAYPTVWLTWFTSCGLGTIIVAPLLIAIWRPHRIERTARKGTGPVGISITIAILCLVDFAVFGMSSWPILFVPFAAIVVATVLVGQRMAAAGIVLAASAGLASLISDTGPLVVFESIEDRVLMLQSFLAVLALTCLPIAGVLHERQALSDRLAIAEARHRLLSEGSGDAILLVNRDGIVLHASRAVTDLTGLSPDQLVGQVGTAFVHPDDRAAVADTHMAVVASGGDGTVRYRYTHHHTGDERWLEIRTRAIVTGSDVGGVIATVRDVTLLVAQEQRMSQEAATDPLTGLSNRRHFMSVLETTLTGSRPGPVGVAMVDIDYFKKFNDRYGHAAGDAVLCAFARAADSALRPGDVIARIGGEEFAIMMPDTKPADAMNIAERVRIAVAAQTVIFGGEALRITVSIGAAVSGPDTGDAAALLAAADSSLYLAKNSGRDRVAFAA